jgi:uncharacterized protein (TIGR03437 family)
MRSWRYRGVLARNKCNNATPNFKSRPASETNPSRRRSAGKTTNHQPPTTSHRAGGVRQRRAATARFPVANRLYLLGKTTSHQPPTTSHRRAASAQDRFLRRNLSWIPASLLCAAVCHAASAPVTPPAVRPLAVQQTSYEIRLGESVQISADPDTLDFLLKATNLRVDLDGTESTALVAGPNRARDQVLLAVPPRTKPGEYTAKLSATSSTGEQRVAALKIVVKPMQAVPTGSSRPPVVLLNGWETGFTGTCTVSSSSSETFGNLAQYLVSDGVPIVYFFDNCVVDPNQTIEVLGNDLGTFLNTIKYADGDQVPQIDLVAFSMGGLIARSYLAGLQPDETATPPATTLVRDLILIATPNFGSFVAGNYATTLIEETGTQSAELVPGSSFLWNLATWNQRGDDLRGVNALAVVGNAGIYLASLSATTQLNNASDGLVSLTSASLGFALPDTTPTQVVPYCHVDPSVFINTATLGPFECNAAGIANVTSATQDTGLIVRSFLTGNTDWQSVGVAAAKDPWLSIDGGIFFAMQSQTGAYVTDLTAAQWGTVALTNGADTGVVFYTDFVQGSGDYQATSSSLGTVDCATLAEDVGYFSAARCKIDTAIVSVGPLSSAPGRIINSGSTITLTGYDFGDQCVSCQVVAIPIGTTTQTALQISSWSDTAISAVLPASMTGLITLQLSATPGTDAITIMAAAPGPGLAATPTTLQFAYTTGGTVPAAQTIQITNSGTGTLSWTASVNQTWLSVSLATSSILVSVAPASLTAGTYNGIVTITATGASNSPLSIAVTLTVTAPVSPASLSVSPTSLTFNYAVSNAGPASAPPPQSVSITNTGSGTLSWTASSSVYWVTLSPTSGSAGDKLSVSVNPFNLAAGSYTGNVQITAPGATGSPASITVTLVVVGTQPAGTITAVTNGASFGATIASATWITIFGANLSATTANWNATGFANNLLPTSVDGLSVTVNGIPAYVNYISPTQINVLAPDDPTTGTVQVQVTAAGQKSNSFAAQKQALSPAFFTFDNGKYVAAQHANYTLLDTTAPAQPGETILLYGTGFGPTDPALPTAGLVTPGQTYPVTNTPTITIGGVKATVAFAGLIESGLYQLNVIVPSNLPSGDAAIIATVGSLQTQSGLAVTIQ